MSKGSLTIIALVVLLFSNNAFANNSCQQKATNQARLIEDRCENINIYGDLVRDMQEKNICVKNELLRQIGVAYNTKDVSTMESYIDAMEDRFMNYVDTTPSSPEMQSLVEMRNLALWEASLSKMLEEIIYINICP